MVNFEPRFLKDSEFEEMSLILHLFKKLYQLSLKSLYYLQYLTLKYYLFVCSILRGKIIKALLNEVKKNLLVFF